jgi:capsule polysaccharide export protein KpsE/RkpR
LGVCQPSYEGRVSLLAGHPAGQNHSTGSALLIANGENVKVVQELMRHASSCTLKVYSQAKIMAKRQAQQRIVEMILPEEPGGCQIPIPYVDWGLLA